LFNLPCSVCLVLAVPFWLSRSSCPVRAVMFWLSFAGCALLSVLPWLSYSSSPILAVMCWQPRFGSPVLTVLFWLSFSAYPLLSVLPGCLIIAVLSCQPSAGNPVPLPRSGCPVIAVVFYCRCFCPCYPIPALSWQSSPGRPVLEVHSWQSCSGCPFLVFLSFCPVLAALSK
jgi:hypothetical protein